MVLKLTATHCTIELNYGDLLIELLICLNITNTEYGPCVSYRLYLESRNKT